VARARFCSGLKTPVSQNDPRSTPRRSAFAIAACCEPVCSRTSPFSNADRIIDGATYEEPFQYNPRRPVRHRQRPDGDRPGHATPVRGPGRALRHPDNGALAGCFGREAVSCSISCPAPKDEVTNCAYGGEDLKKPSTSPRVHRCGDGLWVGPAETT